MKFSSNKKIINTPLKLLLFKNLKEPQQPWWGFECALHQTEKSSFVIV